MSDDETSASFKDLGLSDPLLKAVERLNYTTPTDIQRECIPHALEGRDIIGIAATGSGKTAAFAIPILQKLWDAPQAIFACVLAPTRELAYQISDQFNALGADMGVRSVVIIGGEESRVQQAIQLAKKPHIIVATPGRLNDHLKETKGFSLRTLKFLVLDEADRLLDDMNFGDVLDDILKAVPKERTTYLFSATMTSKVSKLQRASLSNPVKVAVNSKYSTVESLLQYYVLVPHVSKEAHLVYIMNNLASHSTIIFTKTVHDCQRLSILFRILGFSSVPIHGQLAQSQRLGALNKFKSSERKILIATDVASRGLDIPSVDYVVQYDCPQTSKDYIHRVGRTARAGRSGKSILFLTQYDATFLQPLEKVIGKELELWPVDKDELNLLKERVNEAGRMAALELRDQEKDGKGKKKRKAPHGNREDRDRDDDMVEGSMPSRTRNRPRRR